MKTIAISLVTFFTVVCNANTITVGVIDTGFDFDSKWENLSFPKPKICKQGHKDLTGKGIKDKNGHGTHIAGLIGKAAGDVDYCLVIVNYYNKNGANVNTSINAIKYLTAINVNIINYSGGGIEYEKEECEVIKKALDKGILIVAAAGNEKRSLNELKFYPASCDDRITVISNLNKENKIDKSSGYSDDTIALRGSEVISLYPDNTLDILSGSSQATARYTGKMIKTLSILSNRRKK